MLLHASVVKQFFFFFPAEDGIRFAQESRGLGDVYKRQACKSSSASRSATSTDGQAPSSIRACTNLFRHPSRACLLYTSDAADDLLCVDLGGRRSFKQKNT